MEGHSFGTLIGKENSPFRPPERNNVLVDATAKRFALATGIAKGLEKRPTAKEMIGTAMQGGVVLGGLIYTIPLVLLKVFGKQKHSIKPLATGIGLTAFGIFYSDIMGKLDPKSNDAFKKFISKEAPTPEDIIKIKQHIVDPTGSLANLQDKYTMKGPATKELLTSLTNDEGFSKKMADGSDTEDDRKNFIAKLSPEAKELAQKIFASTSDRKILATIVVNCDTRVTKNALTYFGSEIKIKNIIRDMATMKR